jgi:hypothetical protein
VTDSLQDRILAEAKDFADREIRPFAAVFDKNQGISRDLIGKMAERGYLAPCLPRLYGGLELDALHYGLFTEIIGKACPSTRVLLTVHCSLIGETILRWGTMEQKNRILPELAGGRRLAAFALTEPGTGSDAKNVQTLYRQQGDHYHITGKKKFISLGAIADLFLVLARGAAGEVTAFLIDRNSPGISIEPMTGLLASRAAYVAAIGFSDVCVPAENVLGKEGGGFTFIVNTALDYGRYSIAWGGLAIAQESLDVMVAYARNRKQSGRPIHTFQLIEGIIGDGVARVEAARSLCMHAARLRDQRHEDAVIHTTIAKYFASRAANRLASDAVQVHGGNGCYDEYPAERLFREAKVLEIIEGTSQVLQAVIAEYGLRKFYAGPSIKSTSL